MNYKYAICSNNNIENSSKAIEKLKFELDKYNSDYEVLDINHLKSEYDFAFVIGGDGTILKASRYFSKYNTPIFGINFGHLGFLSQAGDGDIPFVVNKIINKQYRIEKRLMLTSGSYNALNDFVIKGDENSRATNFSLYIDNKFVCEYFADGLIVSTPTGSTAYGMASGGPILTPNVDALAIVPICPHTFSVRPLVVSTDSIIKIKAKQNYKYCVSADGQEVFSFDNELIIRKSDNDANLVLLEDNDFYKILRTKLHWGYSPYRKNANS